MVSRERRRLLAAGAALALAPAYAQRAERVHRIGFVSPTPPGARDAAFRQGLHELGYVEGGNVHVEMRFADGRAERMAPLVDELIRTNVDVLVVGATIGARAAKQATSTVPVVFAGSSDPVAAGIVSNLARPEGNVTGVSLAYGDGLAGKWLEILREAVPNVTQFAALWSSSNAAAVAFVDELAAAAKRLDVALDRHHASNLAELDAALGSISRSGARALIVAPSPFAATHRDRLVAFAADRHLPAMYFVADFADAGGLMSYGPSIPDAYRRAASYVDRILRGAKPADLPVEQPTQFEFVVNAGTARTLGLRIPRAILLRADRVID